MLSTELDHVRDDADRRLRRTDPLFLSDELLEHVVLDRTAEVLPLAALSLGDHKIHREQDRRRAIHRHRGRDLVQTDPGEELLHVLDGGDRDALTADFPECTLGVGVVPHQRRHIEGRRKAVRPLRHQVLEAVVGIFG